VRAFLRRSSPRSIAGYRTEQPESLIGRTPPDPRSLAPIVRHNTYSRKSGPHQRPS
jgi:hypothetical protein